MPVIIDNTPNMYTRLAGVLGNALDQYQQQQQQDQQQSAQTEQQSRLRAALFIQQLGSLPPDQRVAAIQQAPDDIKPYILNPANLPQHQPTDAESADANYNKYLLNNSQDFTSPLQGDPSKLALFDKNVANSEPFFKYQGQR